MIELHDHAWILKNFLTAVKFKVNRTTFTTLKPTHVFCYFFFHVQYETTNLTVSILQNTILYISVLETTK